MGVRPLLRRGSSPRVSLSWLQHPEPKAEVGQRMMDRHDGLFLFGACVTHQRSTDDSMV